MISDLLRCLFGIEGEISFVCRAAPTTHVWMQVPNEKLQRPKREGKFRIRCFTAGWMFALIETDSFLHFYCRIAFNGHSKRRTWSVGLNDFQIQHFFSVHLYFWKVMRHVMYDGVENICRVSKAKVWKIIQISERAFSGGVRQWCQREWIWIVKILNLWFLEKF